MESLNSPENLLKELLNRTCIGAVAQPETQGSLLLHFGNWQTYEDPPNPKLLASERGKWSMMIDCPWRLESADKVLCDWRSVADSAKQDLEAHAAFEGLSVETIRLAKPGNDLEIIFSNEHRLRMICDSAGLTDDCWYILRPDDGSIVATRDFRLIYEPPM